MSIEKLKELQILLVQGHSCRASELLDEIVAELEQEQKPAELSIGVLDQIARQQEEIDRQAKEIELRELSYASLGNTLLEIQQDCINERIANAELKKERDALYNWLYKYLSMTCPDDADGDCKNNSNCKECNKITKMVQDIIAKGR